MNPNGLPANPLVRIEVERDDDAKKIVGVLVALGYDVERIIAPQPKMRKVTSIKSEAEAKSLIGLYAEAWTGDKKDRYGPQGKIVAAEKEYGQWFFEIDGCSDIEIMVDPSQDFWMLVEDKE
jgi:hypothetical protein